MAAQAPRILVVDDNEDAADMLAVSLMMGGCETRQASDGPSALAVAEEFMPQVAVLDIGLPVMDGYELARRFAAHPVLQRTRLIALTGYGEPEDRTRSHEAGFSAHLVKPVDLATLRALVHRLAGEADGGAAGTL